MRLRKRHFCLDGTTLVEVLVGVSLLAGFFVSIFELNGICLRYIKSSKNNASVLQGVQDRLEQLRNASFTNLTSASYVQGLMATPANGSEFLARSPTEVVTLSAYPTADATNTQITLSAGASSATINSTDTNLSNATLVKVNVAYTWTETLSGRSRSEQSETIIAAGTKK
jgi:Tfp pilus assembly protein PilV